MVTSHARQVVHHDELLRTPSNSRSFRLIVELNVHHIINDGGPLRLFIERLVVVDPLFAVAYEVVRKPHPPSI